MNNNAARVCVHEWMLLRRFTLDSADDPGHCSPARREDSHSGGSVCVPVILLLLLCVLTRGRTLCSLLPPRATGRHLDRSVRENNPQEAAH